MLSLRSFLCVGLVLGAVMLGSPVEAAHHRGGHGHSEVSRLEDQLERLEGLVSRMEERVAEQDESESFGERFSEGENENEDNSADADDAEESEVETKAVAAPAKKIKKSSTPKRPTRRLPKSSGPGAALADGAPCKLHDKVVGSCAATSKCVMMNRNAPNQWYCRHSCSVDSECGAGEFCSTDKVCIKQGTCGRDQDCKNPNNPFEKDPECDGDNYRGATCTYKSKCEPIPCRGF